MSLRADGGDEATAAAMTATATTRDAVPSMPRWVIRGVGYGSLVGLGAGFVVPWVGLALVNADARSIGLIILVYGWFTAAVGAAYGAAAGLAVSLAALPCRRNEMLLTRLRPAWALVAAAVVVISSWWVVGFRLEPDTNETALHVWEELVGFFALPALTAAVVVYLWAPRRLAAPVHSREKTDRAGQTK